MDGVGIPELLFAALIAVPFIWFCFFIRQRRSTHAAAPPLSAGLTASADPPAARRQPAAGGGSDVFLSYASSDRRTAEGLAAALRSAGWSVWWDRTIRAGQVFDDVIEEALCSARTVVVLWSQASVTSDWVKAEAAEGARRRVLIPVLIEPVLMPLEFRRIQAADLVNWEGATSGAGFESLKQSIAAVLDSSAADRSGQVAN